MNTATESATDPPPAAVPWISTQHALESAAMASRTRYVKVRVRAGIYRIGIATYLHSATASQGGAVQEHLYRVTLQWLSEFDARDGKTHRIVERASPNRPTNALQFRVLESTAADGKRSVFARLGPRAQIAAEPRNVGVMGFLRAILVEWVAAAHPDAAIVRGTLVQPDSQGEGEKALRDAFFVRAGFKVMPTSDGGGTYTAASIKELKTNWNSDKVVELPPHVIADAFASQSEVAVQRTRIEALENRIGGLETERRAAEVMSRIWLAITVLAVVFGIAFGIQPRIA